MMANITVIVPIYNVEMYLQRCVDSILAQGYCDFDVILVDDGSLDRSAKICDEYALKDPRVHVIHQVNSGVSVARNAGLDWALANSTSEYIAFIDSDDWVATNYLEELVRGARMAGGISCVDWIEVCGGHYETVNDKSSWRLISPHDYWLKLLFQVAPWGKLYPKSCFETVRYPAGRIHEDMYITHRLLFQYDKIAVSSERLYFYYRHPGSITGCGITEKTLDVIPALADQVAYFRSIGDVELAKNAELDLSRWYAKAILMLKHEEFRPVLRGLLKTRKLRSLVWTEEGLAAYPLKIGMLRKFWRVASDAYHQLFAY